ncbi:hypothetical protein ACFYVL_08215 [Streptomyces sp. NPDC004111]|uniref:hypothetical protein n=1 Tax=Streptomyces sp. NPDC004111 TaxID=3364690 RepID=UPI00368C7D33
MTVSTCVVLLACACGPQKPEGDESPAAQPAQPTRAAQPGKTSATPSPSSPAGKPSATPAGSQPVPRTKEGAIQRYEQFLRAVGREDITTVCEVAGPAAKQAEDQGFGPCTSTFLVTFRAIPPARKKALRTATVDPRRVTVVTSGKVEIPTAAIRASVTFTEDEFSSGTLEYLKNTWYITD